MHPQYSAQQQEYPTFSIHSYSIRYREVSGYQVEALENNRQSACNQAHRGVSPSPRNCSNDALEVQRSLLTERVKPNILVAECKLTPLHCCIQKTSEGNGSTSSMLINLVCARADVHARDFKHKPALSSLIVNGSSADVISLLCEYGADVNDAEVEYGCTALH